MNVNIFKIQNRFWRMRQTRRVTPYAGDLFGALVQYCNANGRTNPFTAPNDQLCAITGMSLSSLKKARTQLHQQGMVGYLPGQKMKADPWYRLYEDDTSYKDDPRWRGGHFVAQDEATKMHFLWPICREDVEEVSSKSLVSNETIVRGPVEKNGGSEEGGQLPASGVRFAPEEKSSAQKEDAPDPPRKEADSEYHKTPYWRALRTVWFEFNKEYFGIRPSFRGRDHKAFREILLQLEREHFRANVAWTEPVAIGALKRFLLSAIQDDFLKKKFLLINLNDQYDAIRANQRTGSFVKKTPPMQEQPVPRPRPRAESAQGAPPLEIVGATGVAGNGAIKADLFPEEWRAMIEEDYQLLLNDHSKMIFLGDRKYLFLRRCDLLHYKSRDHWNQNYAFALSRSKKGAAHNAVMKEMRRLVYLAFLRRAAESNQPSIFSNNNSNHGKEPGSAGKAACANGKSALQGVCQSVA